MYAEFVEGGLRLQSLLQCCTQGTRVALAQREVLLSRWGWLYAVESLSLGFFKKRLDRYLSGIV